MRDLRNFQSALEHSGRRDSIYQLLGGLLSRLIARRIAILLPNKSAHAIPIAVVSRMFAGALIELLDWSLDREATHSPSWVDARYHEVVWLGLRGLGNDADSIAPPAPIAALPRARHDISARD